MFGVWKGRGALGSGEEAEVPRRGPNGGGWGRGGEGSWLGRGGWKVRGVIEGRGWGGVTG